MSAILPRDDEPPETAASRFAQPGNIEILQLAPIDLDIPAGFPLARFAETAFRADGLPWWEALKLGREFCRTSGVAAGYRGR